MARRYETGYILDSALEEPAINEKLERFHALITKDGKGTVTNITEYGAFVELETGIEGLVHVS